MVTFRRMMVQASGEEDPVWVDADVSAASDMNARRPARSSPRFSGEPIRGSWT